MSSGESELAHQIPTYMFHGTSSAFVKKVLTEGIRSIVNKPDDLSEKYGGPKWLSSAPGMVYLTAHLAPFYAFMPIYGNRDASPAIVQVSTAALQVVNFRADEDFMAYRQVQLKRGVSTDQILIGGNEDLEAIMPCAKEEILRQPQLWHESLVRTGCIAHYGPIPISAIKRVTILNLNEDQQSLLYKTLKFADGTRHEQDENRYGIKLAEDHIMNVLTKWSIGEKVTIEDIEILGVFEITYALRESMKDLLATKPRILFDSS